MTSQTRIQPPSTTHPLVADDRPESSRPKATLARRGRSIGWALLSPAMILLLAMTVGPAILLIYSTLHNIPMFGGESRFVGLRNFQELLTDATFLHSLLVTLAFVAIA